MEKWTKFAGNIHGNNIMKYKKHNTKNQIAAWGITFFSCLYLTYIEAAYTLTTNLQVLFVFIYFALILILFDLFFQKKIVNKIRRPFKLFSIIISISISLVLVSRFKSFWLPVFYENVSVSMSPLQEKNELSNGNEVWIDKITVNEKEIGLSKIKLNDKWKYDNKMEMIYFDGKDHTESLWLEFKNVKNLNIQLNKQSWSGMLEIKNSFGKTDTFDLYHVEATPFIYSVSGQAKTIPYVISVLLGISGYLFGAKLIYTSILTVLYLIKKNEVNKDAGK